jgi:eukaryotic translation initiation factor 2C
MTPSAAPEEPGCVAPHRGGGPRGADPPVSSRSSVTRSLIPAANVQAIGVKRPGHGSAGRGIEVITNYFETELKQGTIHHYDGM